MSYTPINSYATRVGQYLAQITQNIRCNPHWGGGGIENEKRKITPAKNLLHHPQSFFSVYLIEKKTILNS